MFLEDFIDVLEALERAYARYVVVGGGAAVLHGCVREIEDLDLVVDPAPAACTHLTNALLQTGFFPTIPLPLPNIVVMRFIDEGGRRVDVHSRHFIPFDQLWTGRTRITVGNVSIPVVSLDDLIEIKKRRRPNDPDLAPLSALRRSR